MLNVVGERSGVTARELAAASGMSGGTLYSLLRMTRSRLERALLGSATGYLLRRCERPIVVCPRDPAAAMRLRAALSPLPDPRARRG